MLAVFTVIVVPPLFEGYNETTDDLDYHNSLAADPQTEEISETYPSNQNTGIKSTTMSKQINQ